MALEKRKERRLKASLPIKITYKNIPQISSYTQNISRLGAYVELEKEIPAGKEIGVVLEIPPYDSSIILPQEVKCRGNIFRSALLAEPGGSKRYGTGIFFTGFAGDTDRDRLSQYIDYLIVQEDEALKKGLKRWHDKRESAKRKKYLEEGSEIKEAISLLKQILTRLEEIKHSVEPRNKIPE